MADIGVIGAGSWGIALSVLLSNNGHHVKVWSALEDEIKMLTLNHEHKDKLPGVILSDKISFTVDADRHAVLRFYAERHPIWNAREDNGFEVTWDPVEHLLLWKGTFRKGERIEVKL